MEPVESAQPATTLVAATPSARPFAALTDEPLVEALTGADPAQDAAGSKRSRRSKRIMLALSVVAPATGAVWLGTHRHDLVAAFEACKSADGEWLMVALVGACPTYIAAGG